MATSSRIFRSFLTRKNLRFFREFSYGRATKLVPTNNWKRLAIGVFGICAAGSVLLLKQRRDLFTGEGVFLVPSTVLAHDRDTKERRRKEKESSVSDKELRFKSFASINCNDEIYMTMQDFLESVTEDNPRPRIGRFQVDSAKMSQMLNNTPSKRKATPDLFRTIMDKGIISYTEYLFLLCILTKPKAGYEVAFKMFDRDGNNQIDRAEFLLMEEIFRKKSERDASLESGLQIPQTTLLRYFFGSKGNDTLDYATFCTFMDNLQSEVLQLEFSEFSKGMPTISESEFARILLRYTNMDQLKMNEYIQRVRQRIPNEVGINFTNFKNFFQFLNDLDDFEIVLKMFALPDQPLNEVEFGRAVHVATGHMLDPHVVHTVFQIFDKDGDGKLSQNEFIGVMKNRIHRGFREHLQKPVGWEGYQLCIKRELKQK